MVLKFIGLEYCVTVYLGFYNSSMARVNYFHNANSYSSSLDSSMAELLNTLFQNYSHLVLLSHLYQKKSYSLITLTFSISLSLSQSRYHLALTLPHALNLPLSHIAHWSLGFSRLESTPSVLVPVLQFISLSCSNHCWGNKHFGFFWCFVGWEFFILGFWVFGYLVMVLIGGMKLVFFFFFF